MVEAGSDIGVRRQGFSFQDLLNQIIGSRGSRPTRGGSRPTRGGSAPTRGGSRPTRGGSRRPSRGGSRPFRGGSRPFRGGSRRPSRGGGSRTQRRGMPGGSIGDITRGSGFSPPDRSREFDSLVADMKNRFGGKTPQEVEANLNRTDYFNFDRFEEMLNMSPQQKIEKLRQMERDGEFNPRGGRRPGPFGGGRPGPFGGGNSFGGNTFGPTAAPKDDYFDRSRFEQFMRMTPEERKGVTYKKEGTAKEDLKKAKAIIKKSIKEGKK